MAVAVPSRRQTLREVRIVALGVLLALGGCGGAEIEAASGTTTPSATTTSTPGAPGVPGVPWGPNDPPIPGQYSALAVSSTDELDCDAIEQQAPGNDFWATVVQVCRALKGDAGWPASPSLVPPPAENGYQDCLNGEIATMLEALFDWRDAHPGAEPRIAYPPASAMSPCTRQIHGATAYPVPADATHPTGGAVVEIYVAALDEDSSPEVLVDANPVELVDDFSGQDDGVLLGQVFIAAPIEAHEATIVVKADFGDVTGTVMLPDVQLSTGSDTPTTTP